MQTCRNGTRAKNTKNYMASKKPKLVRAVRHNLGIEVAYRKALEKFINDMTNSTVYWLTAQYKKAPPRLAQDATPSDDMQKRFREVAAQWIKRVEEWAPKIAETYVTQMFKHSDSAFDKALKDAGWAVEFKMTPTVRDAFTATLNENISLIKSIPEKYLQQVEGAVMRSYTVGRDLKQMVEDIQKIHPVTKRRAILIARDQSNKANAVVNRARQMELGIEEAIWMHSGGGKEPREDHVKAGKERRKYKIAEGCYISGEYIYPGEKIYCRCTSRAVLPF